MTEIVEYLKKYIDKVPSNHKRFFINIAKKYNESKDSNIINLHDPNIDTKIGHIVDWFNSEGMSTYKSHGIQSIDNAYQLADKFFKQSTKKLVNDDTTGIKIIMSFDNEYKMVQLLTPEALDYESSIMGHCVGQGSYDKDVISGDTIIYSLRDNNNKPHATIEVRNNIVQQIKGHSNKPIIEKYRPYIIEFINNNTFDDIYDIKNIGMVKLDNKLYTLEHLYEMEDIVVKGDVDLSHMNLTKLPKFKYIGGYFDCAYNRLTSLEGCPKEVDNGFYCNNNQLTSLECSPEKVGNGFYCNNNQLTSLECSPEKVGGSFWCNDNNLTSLEGCPEKVGEDFDCSRNKLTTLKGCPQKVGGRFDCSNNELTSLKDCPQKVGGDFDCSFNKLTILEGCPQEVGRNFVCSNNRLTSLEGCPPEVGGYFNCSYNQLNSLDGCPQKVGGDLNCSHNELTTLEYCPPEVGGYFNCSYNQLNSLDGCPEKIGGYFWCENNKLKLEKPKDVIIGMQYRN